MQGAGKCIGGYIVGNYPKYEREGVGISAGGVRGNVCVMTRCGGNSGFIFLGVSF